MDEDKILEWLEKQVDNVITTKILKSELRSDLGEILMCNDWVQVASGIGLLASLTGNVVKVKLLKNGDSEKVFRYKGIEVLEYINSGENNAR